MEKEQIQNLIQDLIEKVTLQANQITVSEENGTNTWFAVEVNEPHFFVKNDGEALYALNHLVRRILEVKNPTPPSIMIDVNNFQKRRIDNVRAVAHMMSERARYFKSNIEVDPMSAFERRIVHEFLSEAPDLETESTGYGPSRRVVIKYIGGL